MIFLNSNCSLLLDIPEPDNAFHTNHFYLNRKNLIVKYQQQKAQELKKRDKIKVLPYLSRKLVSQTKTSDLNLKIIPGPHPPFTFGELALIAGINVLYYFNKFLKKLGFKGFFFN